MNSTPAADNAPTMAASVFRCGCASFLFQLADRSPMDAAAAPTS